MWGARRERATMMCHVGRPAWPCTELRSGGTCLSGVLRPSSNVMPPLTLVGFAERFAEQHMKQRASLSLSLNAGFDIAFEAGALHPSHS